MNPIEQMMECYGVEKETPFTAEKQIELIKLLAMIDTFAMRYWQGIFVCKVNGIYSSLSKKEGEADFTNALAELITSLKNELDHKRVKEILEG